MQADVALLEPEQTQTHWGVIFANALIFIAAFGSLCRIAQYLSRRAFWHDEAFLVLNILRHTPEQLLGKLDYSQAAPPLFLLLEKAAASLLGDSEFAFRLLPVLAGLTALWLFTWLAWKWLPHWAAPWAVGLLAVSDKFIAHAAEVKQYSGDVLAAAILLAVLLGKDRLSAPSLKRFALMSLLAAAAIWYSYPVVFLFGGFSLALLPRFWRGSGRSFSLYLLCNILVAGSFVLIFMWVMADQRDGYLQEYWTRNFFQPAHPIRAVAQLARQIYLLCDYPFSNLGVFVLIMVVSGIIRLIKRRQYELLGILVLPAVLNIVAASLHKYPFGGSRTTVYLAPCLFLLVGFGIAHLADELPTRMRRRYWLIPLPMIAAGLGFGTYHLFRPRTQSDMRTIAHYVRQHRQSGQAIYALGEGPVGRSLEFFCYWRRPPQPVYTVLDFAKDPPSHRFWILWSFLPEHGLRRAHHVLDEARSVGTEVDRFVVPGGAAFLFERPSRENQPDPLPGE